MEWHHWQLAATESHRLTTTKPGAPELRRAHYNQETNMSNQAIKVGELHPVYDDPINRQKCVGMAKI